jgi:hypothetical protein
VGDGADVDAGAVEVGVEDDAVGAGAFCVMGVGVSCPLLICFIGFVAFGSYEN